LEEVDVLGAKTASSSQTTTLFIYTFFNHTQPYKELGLDSQRAKKLVSQLR